MQSGKNIPSVMARGGMSSECEGPEFLQGFVYAVHQTIQREGIPQMTRPHLR